MPRIVLLTVLLVGCGRPAIVAEDTPADLAELVGDTMETIEESLPARAHCLRGVTIMHAWELDDRAEYRTDTRTIVLRVPATAQHLEFSLAHEIAHHLEYTCAGQAEIRPAFLDAQGHEPTQPWFEGESWETTPSEQFATAVARLITGRADPLRHLEVTDEAMELVERWARGDVTHETSTP